MIRCKQLKKLVAEESSSSKEYRRLGLSSIAKDEARHSAYLSALYKRCKK